MSRTKMKSQDILLLLKVVSLSQQANQSADQFPQNWKDWDLTAVLDEGSAHEAVDEQDEAFSNVAADQPPYDPYSVRGLALSTGISKSEVSMALKRCYANGLAKRDRHSGAPRVNTKSLCEFIVHGLRYVFPAKPGDVTRGIATGFAAPVLQDKLMSAGELVPVPAMAEWGLKTEPWVFVVDSEGRVVARFEGPLTFAEVDRATRRPAEARRAERARRRRSARGLKVR